VPSVAWSQGNLGELQARGAINLTKELFEAGMPLTRCSVWLNGKGEATLTFRSDGSFEGSAWRDDSHTSSRSEGRWSFDAEGRWCIDERFLDWDRTYKDCAFRFVLANGEVFVAESDQDPKAEVFKLVKPPGAN
jgi:hypothetical protein